MVTGSHRISVYFQSGSEKIWTNHKMFVLTMIFYLMPCNMKLATEVKYMMTLYHDCKHVDRLWKKNSEFYASTVDWEQEKRNVHFVAIWMNVHFHIFNVMLKVLVRPRHYIQFIIMKLTKCPLAYVVGRRDRVSICSVFEFNLINYR